MQTILVPTDYKLEALDCVPALCRQFKNEELTVVFVHLFKVSDSITDLLMLSRRSRELAQISDEFYNCCAKLSIANPNLKIKLEFFYGNRLSMFKNFLDANEVTLVLDPCDCSVSKLHAFSIDPEPLIRRSGLPVTSLRGHLAAEFQDTVRRPLGQPDFALN